MKGWQELWRDPKVRERWEAMPPLPEVVQMADRLRAEGRNRVLDIGCGLGRHTVYLAARGLNVTATDVASSAIEQCTSNLEEAGLTATMVGVEMTEFPWPDGHFAGVVASNVIHHTDLATLRGIIASITRVLTAGGYFVWATPTPRHFGCGRGRQIEPGTWVGSDAPDGDLPHHYSTEAEVRELLQAYEILRTEEREYPDDQGSRFHWRVLAEEGGVMTESVTIRQATAADRAAIGRLWRELMEFHYQFDSRAFGLAPNAVDIWLHQLDECIADDEHLVLVAKAEDQLVGYAMGEVSEGRPMFRHGPYGHIGTFCVTANWRRRGDRPENGRKAAGMVPRVELSEVRGTAWYSNPASNAFWRSLGFQPKTVGMNLLVDPIADVE